LGIASVVSSAGIWCFLSRQMAAVQTNAAI
jgi:hypothetical protein